jgi:hypothetical protein
METKGRKRKGMGEGEARECISHYLFSPPTPQPNPKRISEVVGWFENLVASIRIKIRIYKNYPVGVINCQSVVSSNALS